MGFLYLVHEWGYVKSGETIYKFGQTTNLNRRIKSYGGSTKKLWSKKMDNHVEMEKQCLDYLKTKFEQPNDHGNERFIGDKDLIIKTIEEFIADSKINMETIYIAGDLICYKCSILRAQDKLSIWKYQRSIDKDRVNEIYEFHKKQYELTGNPQYRGVITACRIGGVNNFVIIDGQHRYRSMLKLIDEKICNNIIFRLDVINVKNKTDVRKEFININKCVPVPISVIHPEQVINLAISGLKSIYSCGFKDGKCRRPRVNEEIFSSEIMKENIIEECGITSPDDLITLVIETNKYYEKLSCKDVQDLISLRNQTERRTIKNCYYKCMAGSYMMIGIFKTNMYGVWVNKMKDLS